MTRQLSVLFISISLLSCSHPEGKKYERNQGHKKEYNSSSNEIIVSANENEIQFTDQETSTFRSLILDYINQQTLQLYRSKIDLQNIRLCFAGFQMGLVTQGE